MDRSLLTDAEKDLLLKKDLHNSLSRGPNRGPDGLMSLNGWGSTDKKQEVAGQDIVDELKLVKFVDEKSTSKTIKKIQKGN